MKHDGAGIGGDDGSGLTWSRLDDQAFTLVEENVFGTGSGNCDAVRSLGVESAERGIDAGVHTRSTTRTHNLQIRRPTPQAEKLATSERFSVGILGI